MTDPEETVRLLPTDLEEVEVDEADEFSRPAPLEAEPKPAPPERQTSTISSLVVVETSCPVPQSFTIAPDVSRTTPRAERPSGLSTYFCTYCEGY